jgi:regulator of sigma E protease
MLLNLLTAVVFLTMFCVMVAAHEYGHYLLARFFKMGVTEFSVGMGPKYTLFKRRYRQSDGEDAETEFNLRALPLGGFVKIVGMEPKEDGSETKELDGFYSKPPFQRILVLLAGPLFSVLLGWLILVPSLVAFGIPEQTNIISKMSREDAGYLAGLRPGDKILKVDQTSISNPFELRASLAASGIKPYEFQIERKGQVMNFSVTPKMTPEAQEELDKEGHPTGRMAKRPIIGVSEFVESRRKPSLGEAASVATNLPIQAVKGLLNRLTTPKRLVEESTGIIGMVVITRNVVEESLEKVLTYSAYLSISIGIFNLLPIGMLDGGQILIALVEWIRRGKRLSLSVQNAFFGAGLALLLMFFLVVMRQDVLRFILPQAEPKEGKKIVGIEDLKKEEKEPPIESKK